jgi:DNA-binding transcriptional LysR family regulator
MDLNELLVFSKVVEKGSLTAAAASLHVTKSTVSRRLADLEERLGCRLIQRSTRHIQVTEAGAQLYADCQTALTSLQDAEQKLWSSQHEIRGQLKVVAPVEFGQLFLIEQIASFMQKYPQVEISLECTNRKVDLLHEDVDVMFRIDTGDDIAMVAEPVVRSYAVMVASPRLAARYDELTSPSQLPATALMLVKGPIVAQQWQMRRADIIVDLQSQHPFQCNNLSAIRRMVLLEQGVALLPHFLVKQDLREGRLWQLFSEWQSRANCIYALYPSRRFVPAKLRLFLDEVTQAMQAQHHQLNLDAAQWPGNWDDG